MPRQKRTILHRKDAYKVELPEHLDTEDFRALLGEWFEWRREEKLAPVTPGSWTLLRNKLSNSSEDEATAAIQTSMANGWQGVFPQKKQRPHGSSAAGRKHDPDMDW